MGKGLESKIEFNDDSLDDFWDEFGEKNPSSTVIKQMFSKKFPIEEKTELTNEEIGIMSQMIIISEKLRVPVFREFVNEFMKLRISMMRKGRTEAFEAVKEEANTRMKLNTPQMSLLGGRLI